MATATEEFRLRKALGDFDDLTPTNATEIFRLQKEATQLARPLPEEPKARTMTVPPVEPALGGPTTMTFLPSPQKQMQFSLLQPPTFPTTEEPMAWRQYAKELKDYNRRKAIYEKGEIGVGTAFSKMKWYEKVPVVQWAGKFVDPLQVKDAVEFLKMSPEQQDAYRNRIQRGETVAVREPMAPGGQVQLPGRMQELTTEDFRTRATEIVRKYLEDQEERIIRGSTLGADVAEGVTELPGYMVDFFITGGIAKIVKSGLSAGARSILKKVITTSLGKELVRPMARILTAATGAVTTAAGAVPQALAMPHRYLSQTVERQLPKYKVTEDGEMFLDMGEKPWTAFWNALTDHLIEITTEHAGKAFEFGGRWAKKGLGRAFAKNPTLQQAVEKIGAALSATSGGGKLSAAGVQDFAAEYGEEALGQFIRGAVGLEESMFQSPREVLATLGVLSVPGAAGVVISKASEAKARQKLVRQVEGEAQAREIFERKPEAAPPIVQPAPGAIGKAPPSAKQPAQQPGRVQVASPEMIRDAQEAIPYLGTRPAAGLEDAAGMRYEVFDSRKGVNAPTLATFTGKRNMTKASRHSRARHALESWIKGATARAEAVTPGPQAPAVTAAPEARAQEPPPAKPAEQPAPQAKQPWEMTKEEYIAANPRQVSDKETLSLGKTFTESAAKVEADKARYRNPDYQWQIRTTGGNRFQVIGVKPGSSGELTEWYQAEVRAAVRDEMPVSRPVLDQFKGEPWADAALAKMEAKPAKAATEVVTPEPTPVAAKPSEAGADIQSDIMRWYESKRKSDPNLGPGIDAAEMYAKKTRAKAVLAMFEKLRAGKGEAAPVEAPAAAPAKELPKGYGAENTLISRERAEAARKKLGETRLEVGIPLDKMQALIEYGLFHAEAMLREGVKLTYGRWARGMKGYVDASPRVLTEVWKQSEDRRNKMASDFAAAEKAKMAEKAHTIGQVKHQIIKVQKAKGMTGKAVNEIVEKLSGSKSLHVKKLTVPQLREVLAQVQEARPKKVKRGGAVIEVVSLKKEKEIAQLQANLEKENKSSPEDFRAQLNKLNITEPGYVDGNNFMSDKQANELTKLMHDEAPIIQLRHTIDSAIEKEGVAGLREHYRNLGVKIAARLPKKAGKASRFLSARLFAQRIQEQSGLPFYPVWQKGNEIHLANLRQIEVYHRRLEDSSPDYKKIVGDMEAAQRISDYIESKLPPIVDETGKTKQQARPYPKDITPEEIKVAQALEQIARDLAPMVRVSRFLRWYNATDDERKGDARIPNAPKKELDEATKIYDTQGETALDKYLKSKTWGVVTEGYVPREVLQGRITLLPIDRIAFGKQFLESRVGEMELPSDRSIFQKFDSHVRQVLNKRHLENISNSMIRMYNENRNKFKSPKKIGNSIRLMLKEFKGDVDDVSAIENTMYWMGSTLLRNRFALPDLPLRNRFQNMAFNEDFRDLRARDRRLGGLSAEDVEFLNTFVEQRPFLRREWLMTEGQRLAKWNVLGKLAEHISIYGWSDIKNRSDAFLWRLRIMRSAGKGLDLNNPESVKRMMTKAKVSELELLEQQQFLGLLASEGYEAASRYAAWQHVLNVHFPYERAQRSIEEMGRVGRIYGTLMSFPRATAERVWLQLKKVAHGGTYEQRAYAFNRIVQMTLVAYLVGFYPYRFITGKKRNPYGLLSILPFAPGSLFFGLAQDVKEFAENVVEVASGNRSRADAAIKGFTRIVDNYVPFYNIGRRSIDAIAGIKQVDTYGLRKLRAAIDKSYHPRSDAQKRERNMVDAFRYVILRADDMGELKKSLPVRRSSSGGRSLTGGGLSASKSLSSSD